MIADLKPYAEYRTAEGGWVGEIPKHWGVCRMKYALREIDSRSTTGKEQLLRISQYTGVTQRRAADGSDEADTRASSLVGYKHVKPGDLVINIMLAWNGSMGVSRFHGIASPAYCVYRFGHNAHPWYFHYLLRSSAYKARIKASSTGVVESRLRLYSDDLGRIEALLPPPEEQAAIVHFLDWANGRLDRAIRSKSKVISLLNEQRQAIIHRAVTRGLDPNVPLKASGVPWLGDVPVHWEVRRMRASVTDCVNGIWGYDPDGESDITCVRVADFDRKNLRVSLHRKTIRSISSSARSRRLLQRGDLLLEKSGGGDKQPVGAVVIYDHDEPAVCSNFVARLSIHEGYEPRFVNYLFSALYACRVNVPSIKQTTGIQNLDSKSYLAECAGFPSKFEQQKIAVYLDNKCQGFAAAIEKLEKEIQLLTEYRIRLVVDIVTGKLDVREAAAKLPEDTSHDTIADMGLGEDTDELDQEAIE